ncbi:MAG: DUF3857 and transglutaminase domain-containing protein [Candidatus Zixiibacteriota bacterium]
MSDHICFFRRIFLASAVIILLFSSAFGQKWGKVSDEELMQGPPNDYPEANAIVLFDVGRMEVSIERVELYRHVRIKILNRAGVDEVGDVGFSYDEEDKIKGLQAQTITPDGSKIKVDKKDFFTKKPGGHEYITFAFPSLDSGCIIEYKYTNSNERLHRLDAWYFQGDLYTLYSEFSLILNPGFVYSSATVQLPPEKREPETEYLPNPDDMYGRRNQKFTWRLTDLPPIKDEPYMSFRDNYLASIYNQLVSYETAHSKWDYIKGWPDIGEKFQTFIEEYVDRKKDVGKITDSLIAGLTDPLDKAKAIYEYIIKEIKTHENDRGYYFSNDKMSTMLENKSGTGDEKNVLLTQMLKSAGLSAWPVLIGTRDKTVFNPKLYQTQQFNRIITFVDIKPTFYYLDATSGYCPFGVLPPESRATGGLLIDGRNSELVKIVVDETKAYRKDMTYMTIDTDGVARCSTSVQFCGYFASSYGERWDTKQPDDFVKDYFLDKLDVAYDMDTLNFSQDSLGMLELDITYSLDDYVRRLDNNVVLKPIQYYFRENPFKSEKRFFPVDFNFPFVYQNVVKMTFNDDVVSQTLPEPLNLEIPGASYTRSCMSDGTNIIIQSQLSVDNPYFPQESYSRLREFFVQATAAVEDEIVVSIASE